jgi:hypothetical protein
VPPIPSRSLADELRRWDDEALVTLLEQRPDLTAPVPTDLASLAVAAASRLSVQRAVDGLDTAALQVLEVLAILPEPASSAEVSRRWGASVTAPLAELRGLGLVWGGARSLRLVRAARDSLGSYPAGLGPPLADALGRRSPQRLADVMEDLGLPPVGNPEVALRTLATHLGDPDTVQALLQQAPPQAREVLDRLVWGPPVGAVADADRPVRSANAGSPVDWLLAHGLLAVADPGHVLLPREIGLALRGGRVHRRPEWSAPALPLRERPTKQVEGTAAHAAAEAVRLVEELCELWGAVPLPVLRAGGIGVRELRRLASTLDVDEPTAALVAEIALAAGLIADDGEADPNWLPTGQYDLWQAGSTGERWARLAAGWLDSSRAAGLVGSRGPKDGLIAALGPDIERPQARIVRQRALSELAEATPPSTQATSSALADPAGAGLLTRLDWAAPRRSGAARAELLRWALQEAAWLGIIGLGALSSFGRLLILTPQTPAPAAAVLDATLPDPIDHVLLQADLTAVAPGRLLPDLERELSLMAEIESRGGAGVFRFTAGSIRRALDAGRTGDELIAWLTANSRTPVPQPLSYLIADSARRYGRLRVGVAGSYLRADDESVLAEVLVDKRVASLRLRRLAPTVLAAQAPPDTVLAVLRGIGLAPAAESPDGELLIRRTPARRATADRPAGPRRQPPPTASRQGLLTAVQGMRAIEAHARRPIPAASDDDAPALVPMDPAGALAVLRDALAARQDVWIGYLEEAGRPVRQIVEPLAVEAGRIRALERQTGRIRNYSVHRVIAVAPVEPAATALRDADPVGSA